MSKIIWNESWPLSDESRRESVVTICDGSESKAITPTYSVLSSYTSRTSVRSVAADPSAGSACTKSPIGVASCQTPSSSTPSMIGASVIFVALTRFAGALVCGFRPAWPAEATAVMLIARVTATVICAREYTISPCSSSEPITVSPALCPAAPRKSRGSDKQYSGSRPRDRFAHRARANATSEASGPAPVEASTNCRPARVR